MTQQPTLTTARLTLRPFAPSDALAVEALVSAYEVALNTLFIPHPYPQGAAAEWIAKHEEAFANGHVHFALVDGGQLVGAMTLDVQGEHDRAEVGYWIGVPFWNRGYATEALAAIIAYGFEHHPIDRIYAGHFGRNPASGRVMARNGMKHEGTLRRHLKKWDELVDLEFYGILRGEWKGNLT